MADPSRFQQVIWNLLRNAVKFTPAGGSVTIATRDFPAEDGTHWFSIEVRDSGIGIEPEAIDRIFRPFEQAGSAGDHRFGGIGLGLAIAQAIVDLHGGTIRAQSEGPGRGAVFVVTLPGATEPPAGLIDPAETTDSFLHGATTNPHEAPRQPLRLLLVEDHEPTLQVLTRLLTRAGHHIVSTSSVAGALAAAAENSFDLVISDLGLPDGTGNALMEQLRDRYQLRGIALTGYGMEEDLERSRQSGFITHLIKPVDFNQLRRVLVSFQSDQL
jgi:CheY-like chemotaxis protein/anti-sigma regulatory factor (Ser/Thr protein kinase)